MEFLGFKNILYFMFQFVQVGVEIPPDAEVRNTTWVPAAVPAFTACEERGERMPGIEIQPIAEVRSTISAPVVDPPEMDTLVGGRRMKEIEFQNVATSQPPLLNEEQPAQPVVVKGPQHDDGGVGDGRRGNGFRRC